MAEKLISSYVRMSKLKKLTETHGQKKKENSIVVEISMARVSYIKHNYTIFYVSQFVFFFNFTFFPDHN